MSPVEQTSRRTPEVSIQAVFLQAAEGLPDKDARAGVVAESLGYLQRGFDVHYQSGSTEDEDILLGDSSYAWAIETIARLDEPDFVAVASRIIRDGTGQVSLGGDVALESWMPHLAGLLQIISGEDGDSSKDRVHTAVEELQAGKGA